jgi:CDP-6-deoxy-D-xylo-4-hexulose-3-dehydrase
MSIFQIVAGNFVKNKVIDYFDYEVHGELKNADYIDRNGLFIGNHHYPITEALDELAKF